MLLWSGQTGFGECTVAEGVRANAKAKAGVMSDFPNSRLFVLVSELGIYIQPIFSSVTRVQDVP